MAIEARMVEACNPSTATGSVRNASGCNGEAKLPGKGNSKVLSDGALQPNFARRPRLHCAVSRLVSLDSSSLRHSPCHVSWAQRSGC